MEDFPKGLYVLRVGDYNTEVYDLTSVQIKMSKFWIFYFQDNDIEEEQFSIEKMFFHEEFGQGGHLNNDIALIRIKTKSGRGIKFGSHVQPICLPPPSTAYVPGMNCSIAGWGSPGNPGAG